MKPLPSLAILAALALPAGAAVTIDYVTVGNAGNAADTTGYGAVAYEYQIGKYEVTNAQYAEFLNAKAATDSYSLYNTDMASSGITRVGSSGSYTYSVTSGLELRPVVYVSWFDAARFSNWLANGQGSGDTETGSYTLNGATSGIIAANAEATTRLPTEDEWYKAAYYDGGSSDYSLYANGQDTITTADANYWSSGTTDVGSYTEDPSMYGTFDQGGNVWEWNDAVIESSRVLRGGGWTNSAPNLASTLRTYDVPSGETWNIGFRVANVDAISAVPEPASVLSTAGLLAGAVMLRRRAKR